MIRKRIFLMIIAFLLVMPLKPSAQNILWTGSAIITAPKYYPQYDKYMASFNKNVVKKIRHRWYDDASYTTYSDRGWWYSPDDNGNVFSGVMNWNCKDVYMETVLYDANDNQVGIFRLYTNEISVSKCTSGPFPKDSEDQQQYDDFLNNFAGDVTGASGSGGSGCPGCDMFNCPGWDEYMGELTGIKNAIPPAPNWQTVSETFRDTIAPQIKADLISVIGTTEDAPSAPSAPSEPEMLPDLDSGGITAPTGQEAPGLEDATFSEDDIKNEATPIQVREDESGGFDITDPLASFPTQEEFLQNKPTEGIIPMPGEPKKDENKPPAPPAIPTGSPPIPTDNTGTAPTPTGSTGSAPIPGGSTGSAPKPTDGLINYPIPGS